MMLVVVAEVAGGNLFVVVVVVVRVRGAVIPPPWKDVCWPFVAPLVSSVVSYGMDDDGPATLRVIEGT